MKVKKLKKKIQQLEKRLRESAPKLAKLKRKLQQAEATKALKAARQSAARATAARPPAKKPKKKLNLSPERRAQLSAAMKARWAAKRAAEGNSATSTNQNSPPPPTQ
jgi:predicted RNase H-like nuclease (RuvC/YqgF family)